jgi:hypothetical protein
MVCTHPLRRLLIVLDCCQMASVTVVPLSGNDCHVFPSRISSAKCSLARKASAMIVSVTDFSG